MTKKKKTKKTNPKLPLLRGHWMPHPSIKDGHIFIGRDGEPRGLVQRIQENPPSYKASFDPMAAKTSSHDTVEEAKAWVEEQYEVWKVERALDGI